MPSWENDIYRQKRKQDAEPRPEVDEADICYRVFNSTDGAELMRHLYALYVDKRCRSGAPEAELREAEAKRRLVADLERLRDQGATRAAERSKT